MKENSFMIRLNRLREQSLCIARYAADVFPFISLLLF
jgi:hypothetical protein